MASQTDIRKSGFVYKIKSECVVHVFKGTDEQRGPYVGLHIRENPEDDGYTGGRYAINTLVWAKDLKIYVRTHHPELKEVEDDPHELCNCAVQYIRDKICNHLILSPKTTIWIKDDYCRLELTVDLIQIFIDANRDAIMESMT